MDNLTHGLFGLAIGALRKPDDPKGFLRRSGSPTDKAVLLGCVVAAELPDLDILTPAPNEVVHALRAHRGISHALLFAPIWALVATAIARLVFRRARVGPVFSYALAAVLLAHILADLWTGWGTRALLPFSDARLSWDLTSVIDPAVTLPLLVGAIWAIVRRQQARKAILIGFAVSCLYLGFRTVSRAILIHRVERQYADASRVEVFPGIFSVTRWRYAAVFDDGYALGTVSVFGSPQEQRRIAHSKGLPENLAAIPTISEALAWARLPLVSTRPGQGGGTEIDIADLRYHLGGEPTLSIVIDVGPEGDVRAARLDRGGSAKELFERWKK